MHLSMTILTTTIDHPNVRADSSWKICLGQKIVGVTSGRVALLAEKRSGGCQQHLMIGTVRRMAIQAAFANRGVTENEGATLFGMALKADFVDRICFQQGVRRAAVGIMAVAATHLASVGGLAQCGVCPTSEFNITGFSLPSDGPCPDRLRVRSSSLRTLP